MSVGCCLAFFPPYGAFLKQPQQFFSAEKPLFQPKLMWLFLCILINFLAAASEISTALPDHILEWAEAQRIHFSTGVWTLPIGIFSNLIITFYLFFVMVKVQQLVLFLCQFLCLPNGETGSSKYIICLYLIICRVCRESWRHFSFIQGRDEVKSWAFPHQPVKI